MIDSLLDLFAPHRCCSCGENSRILCERCKYDIIQESYEGCVFCAKPCSGRGVCETCSPGSFVKQAWCVGERRGSLKALGDQYKFDCRRAGARELAELLDAVLPLLPGDLTVVGVPTSSKTIRVRGFDHTGLVVRRFAKRRQLQIAQPLRRTSTETLHFLGRAEREALADTLFARRDHRPAPRRVLLVDDIVTTGTTLRAAIRLLELAGVEEVYIAVIARQPTDTP